MSEQNWLGNDMPAINVNVMDPLTDPLFTWTTFYCDEPHNHPDEERCGPDCPSTPIYADVYADIGLPNPWTDWPMASVYIGMFPDHEPYYVFGDMPLRDGVFRPKLTLNEGYWTLPDYSYKLAPGWRAYLDGLPGDEVDERGGSYQ